MQRTAAVLSTFWMAAALAMGCGESGTAMDSGGLTSGGAGGTFPSSGGIGGASGAAGMGIGGAPAGAGGAGGMPPVAGVGGVVAGMDGSGGMMVASGGMGGSGGMMASGGMGGSGGMMASGGTGGSGGTMLSGDCCDDGDCICREAPPAQLTSQNGPYDVESYELTTGTVYYPTDAEPPFAAVAIVPGFLNSGPEMGPWGPFYASHGIVLIAAWTLGSDIPDIRAIKLLDAVKELAAENTKAGSPLEGKLAGRYGTSGYSMGGGGTTIAASTDMTLRTSVGLAAWGPVGASVTVPTLFLCGEADNVAACSQSSSAYGAMPESTPKMLLTIPGATHFAWFAPDGAGRGASGARALAFQKVFLEGDDRWRSVLTSSGGGTLTTNID